MECSGTNDVMVPELVPYLSHLSWLCLSRDGYASPLSIYSNGHVTMNGKCPKIITPFNTKFIHLPTADEPVPPEIARNPRFFPFFLHMLLEQGMAVTLKLHQTWKNDMDAAIARVVSLTNSLHAAPSTFNSHIYREGDKGV